MSGSGVSVKGKEK